VPDHLTGVKVGGYYGWPFYYYKQHENPRIKDTINHRLEKRVVTVPDALLGSHTVSRGLVFYEQRAFPSIYQGGAFITVSVDILL
jgi:glucose/arabinose dehydrogenase